MQLPRFEYIRPKNLAEGLAALAEHGDNAVIMSGGSDLLLNMKYRLSTPGVLVSLSGIAELQTVEELADGSLRIGAGCTLTALAGNALIGERYPALHDAIYSVGSRHVRNVGTLGGNLCLDTRCWYTNQSETMALQPGRLFQDRYRALPRDQIGGSLPCHQQFGYRSGVNRARRRRDPGRALTDGGSCRW